MYQVDADTLGEALHVKYINTQANIFVKIPYRKQICSFCLINASIKSIEYSCVIFTGFCNCLLKDSTTTQEVVTFMFY